MSFNTPQYWSWSNKRLSSRLLNRKHIKRIRDHGRMNSKLTSISKFKEEYLQAFEETSDSINVKERPATLQELKTDISNLFKKYLKSINEGTYDKITKCDKQKTCGR